MHRGLAVVLLALSTPAVAQQQHDHERADKPQVLAPGYSALQFAAPAVGSYALPPLGKAADGEVVDDSGDPITLHDLYAGKTIVLSFIYTACPDVNGCPLATFVLSQVQRYLAPHEALKSNVRLLTLSFDPVRDSPRAMAEYGKSFRRDEVDWRFLTTESEESLAPILEDYDQAVIRDRGPDGESIGTMSHILRVYLIDSQRNIRNIYSPSFLHPEILLADIRTIANDR